MDRSFQLDPRRDGRLSARVCTEDIAASWFWPDYPNWLKDRRRQADRPRAKRSEEHGSYIIEALTTGRTYRGHFNVPNRNHITNLPDGTVIEIPGYVDRTGINMPVVGDLPLACAATCAVSARVQEMSVEAARSTETVTNCSKQAMLHDPLVGAVCDPEEIWQMTDEMLVALAPWLHLNTRQEIPRARKRQLRPSTRKTGRA